MNDLDKLPILIFPEGRFLMFTLAWSSYLSNVYLHTNTQGSMSLYFKGRENLTYLNRPYLQMVTVKIMYVCVKFDCVCMCFICATHFLITLLLIFNMQLVHL